MTVLTEHRRGRRTHNDTLPARFRVTPPGVSETGPTMQTILSYGPSRHGFSMILGSLDSSKSRFRKRAPETYGRGYFSPPGHSLPRFIYELRWIAIPGGKVDLRSMQKLSTFQKWTITVEMGEYGYSGIARGNKHLAKIALG